MQARYHWLPLDELHDNGRWGTGEGMMMTKGGSGQELVNIAMSVQRCGRRRGTKKINVISLRKE